MSSRTGDENSSADSGRERQFSSDRFQAMDLGYFVLKGITRLCVESRQVLAGVSGFLEQGVAAMRGLIAGPALRPVYLERHALCVGCAKRGRSVQ